MSLTKTEIDQRLLRLRNLERLYTEQQTQNQKLQIDNKTLKLRVKELEAENQQLRSAVTDIKYQLSELRTIIFKKQSGVKTLLEEVEDDDDEPKPPRSSVSYQRPIPKASEVTKVVHHRFPRDKHGNIRLRTYYIEDIPLGISKLVEKHEVEQYYDKKRRQWIAKDPLPSSVVILGDNVRVLVASLITVERLTYSQVQGLLRSLFNLEVSSGEIAKILNKEASLLKVANDCLLQSIQEEPSHHLDESRYDIAGENHYVWSITGGESGNSVYLVGESRGKGNATKLRGDSKGVLISDDYGAYRYLATHHQLCFAHLIRHFRDLASHEGFGDEARQVLLTTYNEIKAIYRATKEACHSPDPKSQIIPLQERLKVVATLKPTDPVPVKRIKTTLLRNIDKYLTCLSFPQIALTNNAAERSLRHLVLKRKISFGVQSKKGARTMSVLFSVLLSLRRKDPLTYYERYLGLRRV